MEVEKPMLRNYCREDFSKKYEQWSRFFWMRDQDFCNLGVRDEIEICVFYISCFETRSRICSIKSRISRQGRDFEKKYLMVERDISLLNLTRFYEIEISRHFFFLGTWKWALLAKVPIFRCPKMGFRVPESKNRDHFFTPTSPQNSGVGVCFIHLPLLDA